MLGCSKPHSHRPKMSTTPKEHVTITTPNLQSPQYYASRFSATPGYCLLCLDAVYTLETRPVVSLRLCAALLYQRESNETTIFCWKWNTPSRVRPNHRGTAGPSAHHPQASVAQQRNGNPPTLRCQQGGHEKDVNPGNPDDRVPWKAPYIFCPSHHGPRQDLDNQYQNVRAFKVTRRPTTAFTEKEDKGNNDFLRSCSSQTRPTTASKSKPDTNQRRRRLLATSSIVHYQHRVRQE